MKALSISRPWPDLILRHGKNIENRTWRTWHQGPLLIHAAGSWDEEAIPVRRETAWPCSCGPWAAHDQYHWRLDRPRPLAEPIPCRGMARPVHPASRGAGHLRRGAVMTTSHTGVTTCPHVPVCQPYSCPDWIAERERARPPSVLRIGARYAVPGLDGIWRLEALETTWAETERSEITGGQATLHLRRED